MTTERDTFTTFTAQCAGLGGCGRTFRITRETLDATVQNMSLRDREECAPLVGITVSPADAYAPADLDRMAAAWGYDFCLSCATGEDHGAEYVLDGDA